MKQGSVVRVKIWNRDGTVIYSNDKSLIGKRFPVSEQLRAALNGELVAEVSNLTRAENAGLKADYRRLLEAYVPLRLRGDNQIVGAYEVYSDVAPLEQRIAQTKRSVATGVFGGFAVLFLALFGVVFGASRRLTSQSAENARLAHDIAVAYDETIAGWSSALDLRDKDTEGHSARVASMAVAVAAEMGFAPEELADVRRGALLHDIGKMGVADSILLKPGPLDEAETQAMREHPGYAKHMLERVGYLSRALEIPYSHHERWDGTGYPEGRRGAEIPLSARIFAVVDVWDALSSDRPYRPAWPEDKVREKLLEESGRHFDPTIVPVFLAALESSDSNGLWARGSEPSSPRTARPSLRSP
jgi:putative nucleotidyltransferase with HDIG domain